MITYIVPSYNQGTHIKYTLDSVLSNMSGDDTLIIADGASTDSTSEVVHPYLADHRVQWHTERDRGFSDAVAKSLARIQSGIVGIMSADDAYLPDTRARVLKNFINPSTLLVFADYEIIDKDNNKIGERRYRPASLDDLLSLRIILPQSSVFFRRTAINSHKILDIQHDYIADVVLFNQICMQGRFTYVPEIWSQVRRHSKSRTGKRNPGHQYLNAVDTVFSNIDGKLRNKAKAGGLILQARYEASSMNPGKALASLIAAFRFDPLLINHWLLPRTLGYILLGPHGIELLKQLCSWFRCSFWKK